MGILVSPEKALHAYFATISPLQGSNLWNPHTQPFGLGFRIVALQATPGNGDGKSHPPTTENLSRGPTGLHSTAQASGLGKHSVFL